MSTSWSVVFGAATLLLAILGIQRLRKTPKGLLPPGPRGSSIVGNAADMPKNHAWVTFRKWAQKFGGLVYIQVYGQDIMLVNSAEVARDLFENRSSIYSDRPAFPMMSLSGGDWALSRMAYGERWRRHRKLFHQYFYRTAATTYRDIEIKHTRDLLGKLHGSPDKFVEHIRHLSGGIIMEVVYGIKVFPENDPYIEIAEKGMEAVAAVGMPRAFLIDSFPILKHVPEWMPGARFRRKARVWRVSMTNMLTKPFAVTRKAFNAGAAGPSVTASLLEKFDRSDASPDQEEVIRNTAAVAYAGGSGTTVSALTSFILAMVLYPEVQRKAQAELDAVTQMDRLPDFGDRESLPYVNALCDEVLRWRPVVPLGVPHRVTRDDEYKGYFIPGGSTIIGNAWAILHDEKKYGPQPDDFNPDRFLKPGVKGDQPIAAFGFGRRVCPGRYMAEDSIYIAVASILKVFDISLARDDHGNEIPVEGSYTSGFILHPEPFKCAIKPRSDSARSLLSGVTSDPKQ